MLTALSVARESHMVDKTDRVVLVSARAIPVWSNHSSQFGSPECSQVVQDEVHVEYITEEGMQLEFPLQVWFSSFASFFYHTLFGPC